MFHLDLLRAPLQAAPEPGDWLSGGALATTQWILVLALAVLLAPLAFRPGRERGRLVLLLALVLAVLINLVDGVPVNKEALAPAELLDTVLDQVHVYSGGIWLGGVATLAVLTLSRERLRDATIDVWSVLWQRFSIVASICIAGVAVSGLWLAWKHVGSVGELGTTVYGELLAIKLLAVSAVLLCGAYNQLVLMPKIERLRRAGNRDSALRLAVDHFGTVVAVESVLGIAVLAVVGLLSGSARKLAGDPAAVVTGSVVGWGLGFAVAVAGMFWLTARLATLRATRPLPAE